jgi:phage baseplate assembly protein W
MYRGFSSVGRTTVDTVLTGSDLVKADLLNHLNIRPREVPGRPFFGCGLLSLPGRPFTQETEAAAVAELRRVAAYDPRVRTGVVASAADASTGSLRVGADLEYVELGESERIALSVEE